MKNLTNVLLIPAMCLLLTTAYGQVSVGPRVGLNLANWSLNDNAKDDTFDGNDPKNRASYLVGAVVEIRFNDHFAIQPGVDFLQKGTKVEETQEDPISGDKLSIKLEVIENVIEIPLLLKAGASLGTGRIDVLAGPVFAYGMNGKLKATATFNGDTESESEDINYKDDEFSRTDVGAQFGAMFSIPVGPVNLFLDGRYTMGFINKYTGDEEDLKVKNRGIAISLGALFPL